MMRTAEGLQILRLGTLEVDREGYRASLDGRVLTLTRSELELLAMLVENQNRVVSRSELSSELGLAAARSVDVVLTSLRHKVGGTFVRNVRNRGWIIEPSAFEG